MKLVKYINNSRNFTNDISNKFSFISLKKEINKKIKETLLDDTSLFLSSSSFNYVCSNYNSIELVEEGKNISSLLDNISTLNEEQIVENSSTVSNAQNKEINKKSNESEDEGSISFGSKLTHKSQNEENKQKYNINLLNYSDLINLLDIENNIETNVGELYEINEETIKMKLNELKSEIQTNENIEIRNYYLRKMVCLKLYKALNFALKNFNLNKNDIKAICLYFENKGRIIDNTMTNKYKEFIQNVLKKISSDIN